jgi:DNA-binding Xre family transcriptional regulator
MVAKFWLSPKHKLVKNENADDCPRFYFASKSPKTIDKNPKPCYRNPMQLSWRVSETLRRHGQTPADLVRASGLNKTTIYNMVNNRAKAVELETLGKLLSGLEKMLGRSVSYEEVLEKQATPAQARLQELLKQAKPFDAVAWRAQLEPLTQEEKADGEEFIRILEESRQADRDHSAKRDEQLYALFEEEAVKP